ncbi:MAG: DUF2249 domain-containing protein [Proteobacteria bacterium]|nr:DUF2249 domain-containing protein [Pseudomonadota bacterium]
MSQLMEEIDVRMIAPHERHARLFDQFDGLLPGEAFVIINDHNPVPLRRQLDSRSPGELQWRYLQDGPDLWRVQIGKQQAGGDAGGSCCSGGACGGG